MTRAMTALTRVSAVALVLAWSAHVSGHLTIMKVDAIGYATVLIVAGLVGALVGRIWELTTTTTTTTTTTPRHPRSPR